MSGTSGWLQLAALVVALLARRRRACSAPTSRASSAAGALREDRVFVPVERAIYRLARRRPRRASSAGPSTRARLLAFSAVSVLGLYVLQRLQGALLPQPDRRRRRPAGARVQHRRQLRDQHELAELRRRVDDEPPHADERARRAELRLGGGRARGRGRARSAGSPRRRSETIGNFWVDLTRAVTAILLPLSFVARARARQPGRDPEPRRVHRGAHASRARRSRSPAGRSRARRRSRSSARTAAARSTPTRRTRFENPTPFTNLLEIFALLADPVRARVHLRAARRDTRQGWAVLAAMVDPLGRRGRARRRASSRRATRGSRRSGADRRATWRARRPASARPPPASSPRRPPAPRPAPSTARTTASRRSAARCRSST